MRAQRAEKYLESPELTTLLIAQAAEAAGDVAAAKAAFPAFAATPVEERKALLERILAEYKKRIPDFAIDTQDPPRIRTGVNGSVEHLRLVWGH